MNRQLPPWLFAALTLAAVFVALFVVGRLTPTTSDPAALSEPAPEVTGTDVIANAPFRLSDHKGKDVVLINFWATWCGPCRMEIPDLVALQERYGKRGFVIAGLTHDEDPELIRSFAKHFKVNYPLILIEDDVRAAFGGVETIPQSFLVDKNGVIVRAWKGMITGDALAGEIEKLL